MGLSQIPSKGGVPSGNTASRPGSPVIGDTYYNGQLEVLEIYNGTDWKPVSAPPVAPTISSVTDVGTVAYSAGGSLSVAFTAGSGGGTASQYNAYTTTGGFSGSSSSSTVTISGLTNNTSFTVYGNAQNNYGTSVNTGNASAITPTTRPQAPTIGTASTPGSNTVSLTFTAGNNGGKNITNYKWSSDGSTYTAFSPAQTTSPLTITGLTNGVAYNFYIKAVNANGDGEASAQSNQVTPLAALSVDYLIVAGGGGGGRFYGGGGGAGGYRNFTSQVFLLNTNFSATVGAGGPGCTQAGDISAFKGSNSTFNSTSATGGGAGNGIYAEVGADGGSGGGGGGAYNTSYGGNGGSGNQGNYTPVEGYNGAAGETGDRRGGGGGGSSASASASISTWSQTGGAGTTNSITGSSVTYAAGGQGNFSRYASPAAAGSANTGDGGSGSGENAGNGTAGGSGIIILRYPSSNTITIGAGLTGSTTTVGSNKVTTLTAGSGNVSWA